MCKKNFVKHVGSDTLGSKEITTAEHQCSLLLNILSVPWSSPSKPTSTFSTSPQSSSWSPPTSQQQQQPPPQQQQQQQPVQHPTQQQQFLNGHMGQGSSSGGASGKEIGVTYPSMLVSPSPPFVVCAF